MSVNNSDGFIDDFHRTVNEWADSIDLDGEEREEYIGFHMERAGYQRATTWTPPAPDEGGQGGGSSMFSRGRRQSAPPAGGRGGGAPRQGGGQQRQDPGTYFRGARRS